MNYHKQSSLQGTRAVTLALLTIAALASPGCGSAESGESPEFIPLERPYDHEAEIDKEEVADEARARRPREWPDSYYPYEVQ
jgi:hypothetical protein